MSPRICSDARKVCVALTAGHVSASVVPMHVFALLHTSLVVQRSKSLHGNPTSRGLTMLQSPVVGSHVLKIHGLGSEMRWQSFRPKVVQTPSRHASKKLHLFPLSQGVPSCETLHSTGCNTTRTQTRTSLNQRHGFRQDQDEILQSYIIVDFHRLCLWCAIYINIYAVDACLSAQLCGVCVRVCARV
jgi:hypothetical protein